MKNIIIKLLFLSSIIAIAFFVLQPKTQKKHTQQEMENISQAFSKKLEQLEKTRTTRASKEPTATKSSKQEHSELQGLQQSIIAVIYQRPQSTWFIKAKDTAEIINSISENFKLLFVEQLTFKDNQQPNLSHIPESMKINGQSGMRFATYLIDGVEVSISQLSGQQDVNANIKRWMRQVNIHDETNVLLNFEDNNKTVLVKMPK